MIFRVALCVLKTEPEPWPWMTEEQREDAPWLDAYKITLGVNAGDLSTAVALAARAMASAEDENGKHLGGIVIEAHAVSVAASEFRGYEKYFLQLLEQPGIFYASGRTHFGISRPEAASAIGALLDLKEKRKQQNKPSSPSFVFRRPPEEPPRKCRILCPVCGAWKAIDSTAFLYSFFEGLTDQDKEYRLGREAAQRTSPFVQQHLECLVKAGSAIGNKGLGFLYEGDQGFNDLDASKEDLS